MIAHYCRFICIIMSVYMSMTNEEDNRAKQLACKSVQIVGRSMKGEGEEQVIIHTTKRCAIGRKKRKELFGAGAKKFRQNRITYVFRLSKLFLSEF